MREICKHGSEGGAAQLNAPFLPLSGGGGRGRVAAGGRGWSGRTGPDPALPMVGKREISLRRERVVTADRAGSRPTGRKKVGRGRLAAATYPPNGGAAGGEEGDFGFWILNGER